MRNYHQVSMILRPTTAHEDGHLTTGTQLVGVGGNFIGGTRAPKDSVRLSGEDDDVLAGKKAQGFHVAKAHGTDLLQDLSLRHLVKGLDRDARILAAIFHKHEPSRRL